MKMKNLEQYGRRLWVRVDSVPLVENKTSDEVLDKVMSLMQETECDIPEVVTAELTELAARIMLRKTLKNYAKVPQLGFQHLDIELSSIGVEVS